LEYNEYAQKISAEVVQELVVKILAGVYHQRGIYSMSILPTLKILGKNDIDLFELPGAGGG
jgi:hypothetical protein